MDYSKWPEKRIDILDLNFDPFNPRFPEEEPDKSQDEILEELVLNYKVLGMAKLISKNGYYPTESLIAYTKNNKIFVIEGNRRVAACKLLLEPQTAPKGYVETFMALSQNINKNEIKKLKMVFAPSRKDALPIVARKHTTSSVEPWNTIAQAKFYENQLKLGATSETLSTLYDLPQNQIKDFLITAQLFDAARNVDLPENVLEVVENEHKFKITTLNRVFQYEKARDFFGIEFNEKGKVLLKTSLDEFKKGYRKLITDIANRTQNSRTLADEEHILEYLKKFKGSERPNTNVKYSGELVETLTKVNKKNDNPKETQIVKSTKQKIEPYLIAKDYKFNIENEKIKIVIWELQNINLKKYSNACSILLRQLLELATYNFLHESGELLKWENELKAKNVPLKNFPELRAMIVRICEKNLLPNNQIIKALKMYINPTSKLPILTQLNSFVHNFSYHPDEDSLRDMWNKFSEYFKIILNK